MYRNMCDSCEKKPAVRKVVTFNKDKKKVQYLCEDCYYKRQQQATISIMNGIANKTTGSNAGYGYTNICSKCKTTADEFRKSGLLGCENCYNDLAPEVLAMIKASQGKMAHMGKNPYEKKKAPDKEETKPEEKAEQPKQEIIAEESEELKLKKELEDAILLEDFELACELRDKINALKEGDE